MQYSDDDVSVSGSEDDQHSFDSDEEFGDEEDVDLSAEGDAGGDSDGPAAAAAAVAAAAAGLPGSGKASSRDVTDALMSGQLSTQTALLQMELSEFLSEVSAARQQGKQAVVQAAVAALQAALSTLPQTQVSAAPAAGGEGAAAALAGLVGDLGPDAQGVSLSVAPPSRVTLVGSWADGAAAGLVGGCVDVAVQIPSSCMHHKDHLNYRYHAKRAMYLSQLSSHLAAHPVFCAAQQQLSAFQGDPFRPALLLQLGPPAISQLLQQQQQQQSAHKAGRSGSNSNAASAAAFGAAGVVLRLLPTVGLDCFELAKLVPSRNNIRWVTGSSSSPAASAAAAAAGSKGPAQGPATPQEPKPTPHYNAGILQDLLLLVNSHKQQQAALAGGTKFVDALLLLKVWAQQHGLSTQGVLPPVQYACSGTQQQQQQLQAGSILAAPAAAVAAAQADGFSGFMLSALLTAAVQKAGEAAASMSSLQLFRTALQLLADQKQWVKGAGVGLSRDSSVPSTLHQRQQQQQQAAPAEGKVSKDHAKLLQKLQQQQQSLPAPPESTSAFKKMYDVTFLDGSGHLNLAAAVSNAQMQLAQAAAQRSLNLLNRQDLESDAVYAAVFKPGQGLNGVFHYYWSVELPEQQQQQQQQHQLPGDQHSMRLSEVEVEGLVRSALGSRARLVKALRRSPLLLNPTSNYSNSSHQQQQQQQQQRKKAKHSHGQQQVSSASSSSSSGAICVPRRIVVCAVVDPAAVQRLVDVGPAADDAAAAGKYRKLWGDKSELRRFQDGKICEAVVWEGVPVGQRHQIPDLAVAHVLQRHLPAGTVITSCATALNPLLYASSIGRDAAAVDNMQWTAAAAAAAAGAGTGANDSSSRRSVAVSVGSSSSSSTAAAEETAASRAADAALDALTKQLRALNDLALKVIGVQPLSSVTRHTCCFYPEPHPLAEGAGARAYTPGAKVPRVLETIDVMVQLESTGKMPLHPEAYTKTKAALGVQLSSALSAASGAFVTATEEALEVLWQGFAFKLILYLDRDEALTGAPLVTAHGSSNGSNGSSSSSGGSSGHQALPVLLSQHHGLVSALAAAHPAYGPTVRLAKRWMGAHLLLGGQVSEEAVELMVGAAFQGPSTAPPIGSRITGFLGFLHLVSSHPWRATPLLVDSSGEVKHEQRRTLQAEFDALRQAGTAPAMFIATPYDLQTSRWTAKHPSSLVASHLVALARTAHHTLSQLLLLGADAPLVQQQLSLMQGDEQQQQQQLADAYVTSADTHKRSKQVTNQQAGDSSELRHLESRALGRTWRALCTPVLTGFDALILLRKEALPFADRVDLLAAQQLAALVTQQHRQQRRLAGAKQQQQHGGLQLLLGGSGGSGGVRCAAPKNARAILRSIPEQVLMTKPADKLRSELLVGFDPVTLYISLLTQRFGHMAQFCADSSSGFPAVGIKWHPAAFLPAHLKPNAAHAQMEICATAAAAGAGKSAGKGGSSSRRGLVVPNLPQVLCEAAEMGLGLVEEVLVL